MRLDAHATQIDVDVAAGGVKRIRVADDGTGIEREDLALAVARHATSKIASVLDLEAIATLGFRGEALASIAAVARVAIASRALAKPHAWRIEVEGGTVGAVAPAALAAGTTVTIEELYFNTPARRKFLRTEATEWAHCDEAFRRIALAHPDVAFTLTHNGRVAASAAGRRPARARRGAARRRVRAARGTGRRRGGRRSPDRTRRAPGVRRAKAPTTQYIFVNGRYVRDRVLVACAARSVSRHPASRPATRLCAVAVDRSATRRRQRASAEDRSALSRFRRDSSVRPARRRACARGERRRTARRLGGRAARHRRGAPAATSCRQQGLRRPDAGSGRRGSRPGRRARSAH